jgi:succinate-semialdehyde dehydrogenase/glutarate-semialdehyde dehydrogenase
MTRDLVSYRRQGKHKAKNELAPWQLSSEGVGIEVMSMLVSINPASGQVLRRFDPHSDAEIERRLQRAAEVFREYRRVPFAERARRMLRAADLLESEKQEWGRLMTLEMGKPLRAAVQEAEKCAVGCRYYAENAERFLADEPAVTSAARSFVRFQPLGPVLAVMPWNFPFWQVFRFAAPALMAGNAGLLKHASNVPQCALAIEEIFRRAGFPEGVFQTLLAGSGKVSRLIEDARVVAVTLTGSVEAGRSVAALAGKEIKKTVLELGGSDPFIVMPSADLDRAVAAAVQARTINNGQSCIAAKRFIVDRRIAGEFERRFVEGMAALRVGDPMDEATDIGPLATPEALNSLEAQVTRTIQMGARVLLGGGRLDGRGNFFAPTVLADIPAGSPAHQDELFGPVASLFRADGIEEAVRIANDTPFGLGSCVWTSDKREQEIFIERIEAGLAFVNGMVISDSRVPFGGTKRSGYGRELSVQGIREFVNVKTVVVQG